MDLPTRPYRLPALLLVALLALVAFGAVPASARTVKEPTTGLRVSAGRGFHIRVKSGVYTLTNRKVFIRFMRGRSPLSLKKTAKAVIRLTHGKVRASHYGKRVITATIVRHRRTLYLRFVKHGTYVDFGVMGNGSQPKARSVDAPASRLRPEDIVTLANVLASRRGGTIIPFDVPIPTKRFVAPDNGSSAIVPDRPGWTYIGGGGIVAGVNLNEGYFELGVPFYVNGPGAITPVAGYPIAAFPTEAGQAVSTTWAPYKTLQHPELPFAVTSVQKVAGTDGWTGAGTLSALYSVSFTIKGKPWQGLIVSSASDPALLYPTAWTYYYSVIAVPVGGVGGIAPALMNTWATWDNSGASNARLAAALRTLLSIRAGGGPIDPDVFQRAADNWDDYLRGPD